MKAAAPESQPARGRTSREEGREKLLDAAEQLFADHGFNGVPVRDITELAGTRLAEINDQFGGKQGLFKAVVDRRMGLINADRLERLAAQPATGTLEKRVRGLVEAFAAPLLERSKEGPGWESYLRLIAQMNATRFGEMLLVVDQFNPIAQRCIEHLGAIFPGVGERKVLNMYQFMVSTVMTVFANNYRMDSLSAGRLRSADFDANFPDMVEFVVGGMLRLGKTGP
jgi:AcrR family transcriptional regulator